MARRTASQPIDARGSEAGKAAAVLPLRDRKKARQRAELLRIALELFRREGFEKTRMEDIAAQADVSTPTVYNYFASKREVLIELLMQDRREARRSYERIVEAPPADPADALALLVQANMNDIRSPQEKRLWRELIAAVARSHERERDPFDENHEIFKGYIKRLLRHFVAEGKLDAGLPVELAADVVFAVNSHNLRHIVASESCTPERIREMTRAQISLVMQDWQGPRASARPAAKADGARGTGRTPRRPARPRMEPR